MPKYEISSVEFRGLTPIIPGGAAVNHWSVVRPAHDPNQGKQSIREILGAKGETLAVVISYEAGAVRSEVEVPAANIAGITRKASAEVEPEKQPGKGGGK